MEWDGMGKLRAPVGISKESMGLCEISHLENNIYEKE